MADGRAAGGEGGATGGRPSSPFRESPPKAVIDTSPIHMDQNKESLKVKLLLRRPLDQLVAQGIMPPHGQRRSAERAKTGDILKAKIQQRPPRQELERRHILEAEAQHADPSLAERQRMLKKARLVDQLNDQLSHRPGPLELIQKNILHTEEPIEQAVKTGKIPYKATSEGALKRPQHPQNYINPEEDSQGSSEGDTAVLTSDVLETAAKSAGIVVSLMPPSEGTVVLTTAPSGLIKDHSDIVFTELCRPLLSQNSASSPTASLASSISTLSPISSVASPVPCIVSQPATPIPVPPPPPPPLSTRVIPSNKCDAPGKDKNRKKSKSKSVPKARTIKFHEYKGPPSAQKSSSSSSASSESSYDLLLKQQTLLLQFQLQLQHKFPQIILPAAQKSTSESSNCSSVSNSNSIPNSNINVSQPSPAPSTSSESSTVTPRITGKLEDMKVSDLKAELKRRNLPVSGSKPQLIERLKSSTNQTQNSDTINHNPNSVDSSIHSNASMDQCHNSPPFQDLGSPHESVKEENSDYMDVGDPLSPQSQFQEQKSKEDLVREQQRQIEELQRELTISQRKLQELNSTRTEPNTQLLLQKHLQQKQQQAQQQQQNIALQMRQLQAQAKQAQINEEQQRLQQQQHIAFQNQKNLNAGLMFNGDQKNVALLLNGANPALVYQIMQCKPTKLVNGHTRTASLPNFILTEADVKREYIEDVKQTPEIKIEYSDISQSPKAPPLYEEATKEMNKKNNIKSQTVDDVLEILIKNGELPPSAASYPSTPGSAGTKNQEPLYPNMQSVITDLENNIQMMHNSPDHSALSGIDPTELLDSLDLENMDFNQLMEFGNNCTQSNDNINSETDMEHNIVPMDTDEWLQALDNGYSSGTNGSSCMTIINGQDGSQDLGGAYDPLLSVGHHFDPFDLEEYRPAADIPIDWGKADYAT
ncbi:myocardin-related transcription factor A-like isoform X2 [Anthonomus grandis grandis]|nr:myocardin-related transcription factor A-like isoform X2 [Anthonomus grandis grandis]XP_050301852.1 myocardin-related transcription factor A-like isoform X2 [Anthonomus grandis grandis]XP_050301853.1 myocardin-related transcription factor A-like isoform X2 [Anthonomus grandis grandis]